MYWHKGARAEPLVAQLWHCIPILQVTAAVHACQAYERDAYAKNVTLQSNAWSEAYSAAKRSALVQESSSKVRAVTCPAVGSDTAAEAH